MEARRADPADGAALVGTDRSETLPGRPRVGASGTPQGLPGAESVALASQVLELLSPESLASPEATIHGLLTQVVDTTAALCDCMATEFFGLRRALGSQSMAQ